MAVTAGAILMGTWANVGGLPGLANIVFTAQRLGSGYKSAIESGSSPTTAFVGTLGRYAMYGMYPSLMWASLATSVIPAGMQAYDAALAKRRSWWDNLKYPNMGVWYDTESALTMRQSAVQAIQESQINARQTLGNEARMMHQ